MNKMERLQLSFRKNHLDLVKLYVSGGEIREFFYDFCDKLSHCFKNCEIRRKISTSDYYYRYAIYCEEENKRFIIVYNGIKYYLDLEDGIMNSYLKEIEDRERCWACRDLDVDLKKVEYNKIICDLNKLLVEFEVLVKSLDDKERRDKVIKDAQRGIIEDDEAKCIYADCLTNIYKLRESNDDLKVGTIGLGVSILISFIIASIFKNSIFSFGLYMTSILFLIIEISMVLAKFQNDRKLKELEYELSFNKEVKANDISKEMIKNSIDCVTNKLSNISNKDKIIILEKLKRVLELSSLNEDKLNDNIMLRLNIIKQNLKYFESREENTYIADKPKRKVLRPNINNISKKTFTRG